MFILGIETSCDETATAIIKNNKILSNRVFSQINIHKEFGGVVPEIAASSHVEILPSLLEESFHESKVSLKTIDAIAVTGGPGLINSLMIGLMYGKTLAYVANKKFIAINHLEGHALVPRMTNKIDYPYLLLLISGGHSQIIIIERLSKYYIIGNTIDDAVGESFDKVAKMLKVGYPGGPVIEKYASMGDKNRFVFPKPLLHKNGCNFSFSGLKTAVRNKLNSLEKLYNQDIYDICASFQYTVSEVLNNKVLKAIDIFKDRFPSAKNVVISGGVAANKYIRTSLSKAITKSGYILSYPPPELCTDNAVMIAYAGIERLKNSYQSNINFEPRSKWAINDITY